MTDRQWDFVEGLTKEFIEPNGIQMNISRVSSLEDAIRDIITIVKTFGDENEYHNGYEAGINYNNQVVFDEMWESIWSDGFEYGMDYVISQDYIRDVNEGKIQRFNSEEFRKSQDKDKN